MRLSQKEYQALRTKLGNRLPPLDAGKDATKTKMPKYHNQKVYIYHDGFISQEKVENHQGIAMRFDSVKEYNRWCELQMLERGKAITNLERQKPLLIQAAFTDKEGKRHRAAYYHADFTYILDGEQIVEDVKGFDKKHGRYLTTAAFNLKWKLLQAKYPQYVFRLF